jgi:hypothetical protein
MAEITDKMIELEQRAQRFLAQLLERLSAPFTPEQVKWRIGSTNKKANERKNISKATAGRALAYVDSRDIMKRLDDEVGPGNWRDELVHSEGRWICTIYLRLPLEPYHLGEWGWVGKTDAAGETDVEPAKGGASDAFKRAAVKWGPGRSLYDLDSPWVELNEYGNGIAVHEFKRLDNLIRGITDPMLKATKPEPEPAPSEGGTRVPAKEPDTPSPSDGRTITEAQRKLLYRTNFACAEKVGIDTKADKSRAFECANYAVEKMGFKKLDELPRDGVSKAVMYMNEWMVAELAKKVSGSAPSPDDDEPPPPDDDYNQGEA